MRTASVIGAAAALLLTTTLLLAATAARAESCVEAINRLDRHYDLAAGDQLAPPATQQSKGVAVADTKGAGSRRGPEPALSGSSAMPEDAAAPPQAGGDKPMTGAQADPQHLSAATRSQAAALLQSARDEDARGKEDECLQRLREVRTLLVGG